MNEMLPLLLVVAGFLFGGNGLLIYLGKKVIDKKLGQQSEDLKMHVTDKLKETAFGYDIISADDKRRQIMNFLISLNSDLGAGYSWIGLFHNGEIGSDGDHMVKLTAVYESPDDGAYVNGSRFSVKSLINKTYILHMGDFIERLRNDSWYVNDAADLSNPVFKQAFIEWGVKENVCFLLKQPDGTIVGAVGINWFREGPSLVERLGARNETDAIHKLQETSKSVINILLHGETK